MSNTVTVTLNEKAFEESFEVALAAVGSAAVEEIKKNTPRDENRPPKHNLDRKDGQKPTRKGGMIQGKYSEYYVKPGVVNLNGHWYPAVSGNLGRSLAFEIDTKNKSVSVGISRQGSAINYAEYLEGRLDGEDPGTPSKKGIRPFVSYTLEDPDIQDRLAKVFEIAFFNNLQKYND